MTAARPFHASTSSGASAFVYTALLAAVIIAFVRVVGVSAANPTGRAWGLVPVLASLVTVWSVHTSRWRVAWTAIGAMWGLIVLGFFSIGSWFLPGGLIAIGLGAAALRKFSRLPVALLCFALGATGIVFLETAIWKSHEYPIQTPTFSWGVAVTLSAVEQYGSALFLLLITATIVVTWIRGPRRA